MHNCILKAFILIIFSCIMYSKKKIKSFFKDFKESHVNVKFIVLC